MTDDGWVAGVSYEWPFELSVYAFMPAIGVDTLPRRAAIRPLHQPPPAVRTGSLEYSATPLAPQEVARAFEGKRAATVRPVLDALAGIGMARRLKDGRYAARVMANRKDKLLADVYFISKRLAS